jgi:dUTP pyrophosphatase
VNKPNTQTHKEQSMSAIWMEDFSKVVSDTIDFDKQVQVNGVDLTVKELQRIKTKGVIDFDNSKRQLPEYEVIPLTKEGYWDLEPGSYILRYNEIVSVPKNAVGIIQPRSSLLRMGGTVIGAWWDSGYSGRGQGLLILHASLRMYKDARVAQIVFLKSDPVSKGYAGQYQNEAKE